MIATPRADRMLPTGTVTFLFTDIEDSTRLWETQHAAMQLALLRLRATMNPFLPEESRYAFGNPPFSCVLNMTPPLP